MLNDWLSSSIVISSYILSKMKKNRLKSSVRLTSSIYCVVAQDPNVYKNTILIDWDKFRKLFKNDLKFYLKNSNKNAERIIAFVKFLDNQKINVILAVN